MKLLLINKDNPLPENYKPCLKEVCGGYFMEKNAADALSSMICAALCDGIHLRIFSAYRSVSYQRGLFNQDTDRYILSGMSREEAFAKTAESIAIPGQSEHNAGLAADISSQDWIGEITQEFENTPEFEWLFRNAPRFGYILRYPKGKSHITGITYEPWHYRYVGIIHAKNIADMNLTLEEYMKIQKCYV